MAALLLGDIADARKLFETTLEVAGRVGDRPEVARAHVGLAYVLFDFFPEEKAAAVEHLNIATQEAQAMKMKPLLDECLALKLRFQGITSTDVIHLDRHRRARSSRPRQPDLQERTPRRTAPSRSCSATSKARPTMTDRLGDARFMEVLREHNAIIREQIKAHGGFEVKSEGDGFMVAFQSAGKALACAVAIQKALARAQRRRRTSR